jgi:hypothetical protein
MVSDGADSIVGRRLFVGIFFMWKDDAASREMISKVVKKNGHPNFVDANHALLIQYLPRD